MFLAGPDIDAITMHIHLRFFAGLREALGLSSGTVMVPDSARTAHDVPIVLRARGGAVSLMALEQIVLAAVAARHRGQAFAAREYVMDYLKTRAPFWQKESAGHGARWVGARDADEAALARWEGPAR